MAEPYYEDEQVTIYHNDAREILPHLQGDVVLTDPPYGNNTPYESYEDSPESLAALIALFPLIRASAARVVMTPGNSNQHRWPPPDWTLAWFIPAGAGRGPWGFSCWQPVLAYGSDPYLAAGRGCRPDAFILTQSSEVNGHPCPKPIWVMRWLVERASFFGQTVIDPFMGSGTTLRAAKDLGRKAIGIEIEERYCEIAARRMAQQAMPLEIKEEPTWSQLVAAME